MNNGGSSRPGGELRSRVIRDAGELRVVQTARPSLGWRMRNMVTRRRELPRVAAMAVLGRVSGVISIESRLQAMTYRRPVGLNLFDASRLRALLDANVDVRELARCFGGDVTEYGTLSRRVVTDAGVGYIVDAFQNLVELENMKYHGFGTGGTAEGASQTALVTELTTQYNPDSTRPTGSQTESAANIYRTVATLTPDAGGTIAVTEHGLFSAASAGVLFDRSLFSAVNITAGSDSMQATYDATFTSGG